MEWVLILTLMTTRGASILSVAVESESICNEVGSAWVEQNKDDRKFALIRVRGSYICKKVK